MPTIVVIFKILFLVLIAHSCCWLLAPAASGFPQVEAQLTQNRRPARHSVGQDDVHSSSSLVADSSSVQQPQKFIPPPPTTTTTTTARTTAFVAATDSLISSSEVDAASSSAAEAAAAAAAARSLETAATVGDAADVDEDSRTREQLISTTATGGSPQLLLRDELTGGQRASAAAGEQRGSSNAVNRGSSQDGKQQEVNYAELCYLSNGGSSLTLTVNEASPVGFVIGTIEVSTFVRRTLCSSSHELAHPLASLAAAARQTCNQTPALAGS